MWKSETDWSIDQECMDASDDDPEIKVNINANATVVKMTPGNHLLQRLAERYSQWTKMVRIVALVIKFVQRCRKLNTDRTDFTLSVCDIKDAETAIL